jgi:hypothetical protein
MNLTGGNTLPKIGKRINWHVITLAGGLAVALSVVAGLNVVEKDTTQAPATAIRNVSEPPAASTVSQASTRPQVIIVDSQAQADALQADLALDQMAAVMQGYEVPSPSLAVIDSPDKQYLYNHVIADQMEFGTFDIVDLRGASTPGALLSYSDATLQSSTQARPVLYVVESAEKQAVFSAALETDRIVAVLEGNELPFQQTSFLVVSTAEDERALNETLREQLTLADPAFEIVDLRK